MSSCGDNSEQGKSLHVISDQAIGHVERQAEVGFTTGGDKYDMYRPTYTDVSVDLIASEIVQLPRSSLNESKKCYDVLELGAGTGKMTEKLSKKLPENVKYLATDMSENFLDILKGKGLCVDTSLASADKIPLEDKSVGSVLCAQCFHWFSSKPNLESIHRVLAIGGKLILIWNMADFDDEWRAQLIELRQKMLLRIQGSLKYDINSLEWQKDISVSPLFTFQWHKSLPGVIFQGNLDTVTSSIATSCLQVSSTM
jgi:ubiquinone/menaquinone biosynthesis C-methylase UbiE